MNAINQTRLSAGLYIAQVPRMHILVCRALAVELEVGNKMSFDLVGPTGQFRCRWVDARSGIFERIGGGAMHINGFQFVHDIHCENLEDFS